MWKVQVARAIREVRFVLKSGPEHHGTWRYVKDKLPEIRLLNQNTFFSLDEISDAFKSPSACYVIYGDKNNTEDVIDTTGLTTQAFELALKEKVAFGLTLDRGSLPANDDERSIPIDIVESNKYKQYLDDTF